MEETLHLIVTRHWSIGLAPGAAAAQVTTTLSPGMPEEWLSLAREALAFVASKP